MPMQASVRINTLYAIICYWLNASALLLVLAILNSHCRYTYGEKTRALELYIHNTKAIIIVTTVMLRWVVLIEKELLIINRLPYNHH